MQRNGFGIAKNPILRPLDTIECRDAILNPDGTEPEWPEADVIIGNPPFLGGVKIRGTLGNTEYARLRAMYSDRLPATSDLVTYWFDKAALLMVRDDVKRVGLVATNSIRDPGSRHVLEKIVDAEAIFEAWSDEEWAIEGAAVRVSLVCFAPTKNYTIILP